MSHVFMRTGVGKKRGEGDGGAAGRPLKIMCDCLEHCAPRRVARQGDVQRCWTMQGKVGTWKREKEKRKCRSDERT